MTYNPKTYWEKRLTKKFNLSGVGYVGFNEYYNKWLYKAKIRTLKKALSIYNIDISNKTICDIGCGTGFFVEFYKQLGAKEIVGIDITNVSIENLKLKYPEYNFIRGDVSSCELKKIITQKFDILNVFDVLYHIKNDRDFEQAIMNISNFTQKMGLVFITDLYGLNSVEPAEHVKFRDRKIYDRVLSENGIEIVGVLPIYYLLNQPIFGKIHRLGIKADNLFAPIYYYLDGLVPAYIKNKKYNLKLIICRKATT